MTLGKTYYSVFVNWVVEGCKSLQRDSEVQVAWGCESVTALADGERIHEGGEMWDSTKKFLIISEIICRA